MPYIKTNHKKLLRELRGQDKRNKIILKRLKKFNKDDNISLILTQFNKTLASEIVILNSKQPMLNEICNKEAQYSDEYNETIKRFADKDCTYPQYNMKVYKKAHNKSEEYRNISTYYKKAWVENNKKNYEIEDKKLNWLSIDSKQKYLERKLQDKQIEEIMVLDYEGLSSFNSYDDITAIVNESKYFHSHLNDEIPTCTSEFDDNRLTRLSNIRNIVSKYESYYKELEGTNNLQKSEYDKVISEVKKQSNKSIKNLKEDEEEFVR